MKQTGGKEVIFLSMLLQIGEIELKKQLFVSGFLILFLTTSRLTLASRETKLEYKLLFPLSLIFPLYKPDSGYEKT